MNTTVSSAAQVIISLIPIVGIGAAAILIFFALLWHHMENRQQIRAGTYKPKIFDLKSFSLLTGLLLVGVGLILSVMFIMMEGLSWNLIGGLIPLILGVMFLVFYKLNSDFHKESEDEE